MNIKTFFTKKRIIYGAIILVVLIGGYFLFFNKKVQQQTMVAHASDFLQQVSVSGKVAATENLDLSFEQPGIIRQVTVKAGDTVTRGKFLAGQDTGELASQLAQMQAGIDLQKAKLNQLLAGSSPEDIKIKMDAVISAKQDLASAYESMLASLTTAYNTIYNSSTLVYYMQRTYFISVDQEGVKVQGARNRINQSLADAKTALDNAKMSQDSIDSATNIIYMGLNNTYADVKTVREQCDLDTYYTQVSAADKTSLDTQRVTINTSLATLTSSKQSIVSYKAAVQQAENQLDAIQAPSRQTDIAVFQAQIQQAEAQAQNVVAQIRKRQIFSPIDAVVTNVDAKVGSVSPNGPAVSIISKGKFEIESYVPEIYISLVKVGNDGDVTLDSYGPDKVFKAKVISIDPSETVKDGVSTYKIKLELEDGDEGVRNGMSANVIITTDKKSNTISVPQGIIISKNGQKFVKVKNGETIKEQEVTTGEFSSSGQVEIVSGLKEGDVVIIK